MCIAGCRDDETEEEQAQKDRLIQASISLSCAAVCCVLPATLCAHLVITSSLILVLPQIYNRRLDERERRRQFVLDRGLLNVKRQQVRVCEWFDTAGWRGEGVVRVAKHPG